VKRVSNDGVGENLAELEGDHLHFQTGPFALLAHPDEALTSLEANVEDCFPMHADQIVLSGEGGVLWVLDEGIGETISDGETLEVEIKGISVIDLLDNVRANGWNIVACIRLTGDVEIATFKLRVLFHEAFKETVEVLGDLFFAARASTGLGM